MVGGVALSVYSGLNGGNGRNRRGGFDATGDINSWLPSYADESSGG